MRPALYGSQAVFDKENKIVGYNIGYNFFNEHECGTHELVEYINRDKSIIVNEIQSKGIYSIEGRKAKFKYNKINKEDNKAMAKWDRTPFKGYILSPHAPIFIKKITTDNSSISTKYKKFLLSDNCNYTLLMVSSLRNIEQLKNRLGKRRIITEEEIFFMRDYNEYMHNNIGYNLNNQGRDSYKSVESEMKYTAGQWASDGFMILFQGHDEYNPVYSLANAIKNGNLAVVPEEPRLFKDRGCCLIDLDAAYKPRI